MYTVIKALSAPVGIIQIRCSLVFNLVGHELVTIDLLNEYFVLKIALGSTSFKSGHFVYLC